MHTKKFLALCCLACLLLAGCKNENQSKSDDNGKYSGEKFNEHIRSTEARTPEEERAGFKVPEGFEITLYASEPDIGKPINIAFDAKGRLWVTQSFEYPFPATPGEGKDRLTILEDTDNDGKADKFTHFNDSLNIPIGVMPVTDGAVAYSIPNVYKFNDANKDGKPDSQKKLLGPFEHRDTHGMVNNFMIGFDGWIHACHGFTNRSTVAGADGDSITMISGNTFRFRRDGSRVEQTTYGRINPFGLAYDEMGYLYSTDCHTSPLYQLIRGGDYSQWGKEEGMGFAPDMKPLEDEATALAGIAYYADTKYPEAYRKNLYIGDAVSCRVYRNSFSFNGSSPVGKKEDDFVLSEDPWFRPVDVKLGPDGALYIADFYNSIIGHYEVPLDHPKRDRIRGRIWRITYKGETNKNQDWTTASVEQLIAALDHDNLAVRLAVADQLAERIGQPAVNPAKAVIDNAKSSSRKYVHALWVLQRLGALDDNIINKSAIHNDPVIRLHTMRVLLENKKGSVRKELVLKGLQDRDPHVKRAATELMVNFPEMSSVETLIALRKSAPQDDSHLIYTTRLVLRNLLRNEPLMKQIASRQWQQQDAEVLATVMPGIESSESGSFLFNYIKNYPLPKEELHKAFQHTARFVPANEMKDLTAIAVKITSNDVETGYRVFQSMQQGITMKGGKEDASMQDWGKQLAVQLLNQPADTAAERRDQLIQQQRFAIDVAGNYKVESLEPRLLEIAQNDSAHIDLRISAMRSLLKLNVSKHIQLAKQQLNNRAASTDYKRRLAGVLGDFQKPEVYAVLAGIKDATPDIQRSIVMSLANTSDGRNIIFDKVKKGEIFARTLIEPAVEERILLKISPQQKKQYEELTSNLEEISKEKQKLIYTRLTEFNALKQAPSIDAGLAVFQKNCSPCHSVGNEGGMIGPQLSGVGKWGATALAEKILDPNRNISEAFRTYTLKLKDGKVLSGLYRRDQGEAIVFAEATGQEFSVAKKDIAERQASKYTLMPDNFGTVLSQEEFNALLTYLLSLKN
jgi:putative heme-binding domain-containing protein